MKTSRRDFLKKTSAGVTGITLTGMTAMSARSYGRIMGANDRLKVAIAGLGRRLGAYIEPVSKKESNVELAYLCDVMASQRERAAGYFSKVTADRPVLENDIRRVIDDPEVDAILNATPDHWHTPLTIMAVKGGKNVYVEKPCSHNPREGELLTMLQEKHDRIIQMGVQQRSAPESIEIIGEIHDGVIGDPYKATAFYSNARGRVVNPSKASPPEGLDWDLFQGPSPRKEYMHDTWNYNWHWYGWDFGTAETGNNATHELDVARWALQVGLPEQVMVEAAKRHFVDDGWTMYDTMDVTFRFPGNKIIEWDGKSRNGHKTYCGADRGTVIYGTEGTVFVNRDGYELFDRSGKKLRERKSGGNEAGTALGGGGDMSTMHVMNLFDAIRGKVKQNAPIGDGVRSTLLDHLANIAYRVGKPVLTTDPANGKFADAEAMKLWSRQYEPGWEPMI